MPHPTLRAGLAALAALAAVLLLPGAAAAAPTAGTSTAGTSDPAEAAAGWLATQLVDGDHIVVEIDLNGDGQITDDERFPDYGLTADTILALAAAGVGGDAIAAATDYLQANIELYVGDADDSTPALDGEYYAGALAKALLVADVTGRDPHAFGGVDLVGRLQATEQPSGRYSDISAFGDFSNNIGQSLAILALQRTADGLVTRESTHYLRDQQCLDEGPQDGNVPVTVDQDPCAATSVSIDTTGFAIQAFQSIDAGLPQTRALAFLVRSQEPDGGFSDMGVTNANSTGLAAQALTLGEPDSAAGTAAVQWLLDHQADCSASAELQGAVAFSDGPDGQPLFDDRATRATTQAVPALADVTYLEATAQGAAPDAPRLDCTGPTPTSTATPTPTPTATATATPPPTGTTTAPPSRPTTPPTISPPGLPNTGTAVGPLLGVATGSLLLGGGLVVLGRRPGAHR